MSGAPSSFADRVLAALGSFVVERAGFVAVTLVLSLLPAGWLATSLPLRASFLDLLPEDEEPVVQLREVLTHARSSSDVLVAISREDPDLAERYAAALVTEFERDPEIAGVGGHLDPEFFRTRRLLFMPEDELERLVERVEQAIDRHLLRTTGLYVDLEAPAEPGGDAAELLGEIERSEEHVARDEWVVTSDGRYLCVWAYFAGNTGDLEFGRDALGRVRAIDARLRGNGRQFPRDLEVRFAGGIASRVDDERALSEDLRIAGVVGFLAVVLLIVASLRAPRALVVLAVPLLTGLVWTFAFARIAVGHLNIVSGFLFSILSGLGIEYGIHLMHRYRELREEGLVLEEAIPELVRRTGRALLSGSMTNASVFAVIAAAQFRGFAEFGLIAAVGLLLTLTSTLVGLPALLVLVERLRPSRLRGEPQVVPPSARPVRIPPILRWAVVLTVPAIAAFSVALILRGEVRFDGNWRLLAGASPTSRFQEYLRHHFTGLYTGALVFVPNEVPLEEVVRVIDRVRDARAARGLQPEVVEVDSLDEVFPSPARYARRVELARALGAQLARVRPETLDDVDRARLAEARRLVDSATEPLTIHDLPYSLVGSLVTRDGRGFIVHLRVRETDDTNVERLERWADEVRDIASALREAGIHAPILSENWVAGEIFERIARDAHYLLFGTLLAVFFVLLTDFRRPLLALGVLGSVVLGVLALAFGMWATRLSLNFMNAAILPVFMGISLDNAIHVYHRWREGGPGSIPLVLRQTTSANALASATNLLGFAALALTHHEGLRSVAYLAMLGITSTYVSTTLWFPLVLATLDERSARRTSEKSA